MGSVCSPLGFVLCMTKFRTSRKGLSSLICVELAVGTTRVFGAREPLPLSGDSGHPDFPSTQIFDATWGQAYEVAAEKAPNSGVLTVWHGTAQRGHAEPERVE